MWHGHEGMGWWMVFGGAMWLIFVVLIVVLVIAVIRPSTTQRGEARREDDAMEIARSRYARGEISREEFEQLRKHLMEGR
jgi:putative membrane protein